MTDPIAEKTATAIKTYLEVRGTGMDSIFNHLTELMGDTDDRFLTQQFYDFKRNCETLLVFIARPEINKLLPAYVVNDKMGEQLLAMIDFFSGMATSETVQAELDLWAIEHHHQDAAWIEGEAEYYQKKLSAHKAERKICFGETE